MGGGKPPTCPPWVGGAEAPHMLPLGACIPRARGCSEYLVIPYDFNDSGRASGGHVGGFRPSPRGCSKYLRTVSVKNGGMCKPYFTNFYKNPCFLFCVLFSYFHFSFCYSLLYHRYLHSYVYFQCMFMFLSMSCHSRGFTSW